MKFQYPPNKSLLSVVQSELWLVVAQLPSDMADSAGLEHTHLAGQSPPNHARTGQWPMASSKSKTPQLVLPPFLVPAPAPVPKLLLAKGKTRLPAQKVPLLQDLPNRRSAILQVHLHHIFRSPSSSLRLRLPAYFSLQLPRFLGLEKKYSIDLHSL